MMTDTQKIIFRIMASTNANQLIYYFKRIPLIGKLLSERIYGNLSLKKNAFIIAFIFKLISKFIGRALIIAIFIYVPVTYFESDPNLRYTGYLHIFLMINGIGSFLTSYILDVNKNKYICIRLMHMNAKDYIVSTVLFHEVEDFFVFCR